MSNLFALCRDKNDEPVVKRVRLTQSVQAKIEGLFQAQTAAFLDGITEEVDFSGDWKPDSDELLVIDAPAEADLIAAALDANTVSLPEIDGGHFQSENIRALFVPLHSGGQFKISIQLFTAQQILSRRFMLLLDGNTFRELTDPAFTLDNYIHAIIEDKKLKFKSFFNIKRIFALKQFYVEATDSQIDSFCSHPSLEVMDTDSFKSMADQNLRKMVHAVARTGVLDKYSPADIVKSAGNFGLIINLSNGKMVVPNSKREAKLFLRFIDDGIYQAPLSSALYMTNSKRPFE
ncbi:Kiwa anti-phage protein KwaB-like domain-containing protein [Teichococcus aestuarii]|uniref:Kiwa anti-phage protein KwaB-like domain-containing protein n=1 Tax=Teichococcus aestuarii TaxID=568898 RepID=UPI003620B24B